MVVVCRRHAAWSIATFADGLFSSFILPFGPLLLLSHLELASNGDAGAGAGDVQPLQEEGQEQGREISMHWAVVAKLWSQVGGERGKGCVLVLF